MPLSGSRPDVNANVTDTNDERNDRSASPYAGGVSPEVNAKHFDIRYDQTSDMLP